jgi:hypothetical protein
VRCCLTPRHVPEEVSWAHAIIHVVSNAIGTMREVYWTEQALEVQLQFQVVDFGKQLFVWVSAGGARLDNLHMSVPSSEPAPPVSALISTGPNNLGGSIAQRLSAHPPNVSTTQSFSSLLLFHGIPHQCVNNNVSHRLIALSRTQCSNEITLAVLHRAYPAECLPCHLPQRRANNGDSACA